MCIRYSEYERQIKEIMSRHKEQDGISYFDEEDRILPVLTLVLYYGRDEWKRPRTLFDVLDFRNAQVFRERIPDYPVQILSVRTDIDIELFRTELREVMGILQRADDKEAMRRFFDENRQAFSRMKMCIRDRIITVAPYLTVFINPVKQQQYLFPPVLLGQRKSYPVPADSARQISRTAGIAF